MKVLFATSTFPRWHDDQLPDFVWRQVQEMTKALPHLDAYVLAPHDAGARRRESWEGVEIRRFRYFIPASMQKLAYPAIWPNIQRAPWLLLQVPFLILFEFLATVRWILEEHFDVVYSHWFMPQGVACGLAALVTGTPHVFTSHSSDVALMRKLPVIGPWIVRALTRRARAITVVSERSRAALESFFSDRDWIRIAPKVAVMPMGVTLDTVRDDAAERARAAAAPKIERILFLGRLVEKKGVAYLLEAMTIEPLRSMEVRLTIAGDGPLLASLRAQTAELGLTDRVEFRGYVTGPAKAACYDEADVVVIPSIVTSAGDAEGMPVVLLEALGAATVCVATDASGAPEVLRAGEHGLIVAEKDSAALSRATAEALRMPAERKQAMRDAARRLAQRFQWSTVAPEHARHLFRTP